MRNTLIFIALTIFVIFSGTFLTSCVITRKFAIKNLTVEKGAIPPNFGEKGTTLLIVKARRRGYNRIVKKAFANYIGKYKMVEKEVYEVKYSNKEKYPFVFNHFLQRNYIGASTTGAGSTYSPRYFIYDRLNEIQYIGKYYSESLKPYLEGYVENLNRKITLTQPNSIFDHRE